LRSTNTVTTSAGTGLTPLPPASFGANAVRPDASRVGVKARVRIRVRISKGKDRAHYISPATKGMTLVAIGPVNSLDVIA
jgi:hypothetical protein